MFKAHFKMVRKFLCILILCMICLTSCGIPKTGNKDSDSGDGKKESESFTREIFAMDTYMTLSAYGVNSKTAVKKAVNEIERLDKLLSAGDTESEIAKLNNSGSEIVSGETADIFAKAAYISESTGGAFDVTIYPLMEMWGFTDKNFRVPSKKEIEKGIKLTNSLLINFDEKKLKIDLGEGQKIDFGGIAKGYTSDRVMEILKENGIDSAMISLGGNVHVLGSKTDGSSWKIGIQNPDKEQGEVAGVLEIEDKAAITSGGYERYFEEDGKKYHHIINPFTGYPAESGLKSVTIVSNDGTLADGLSTALYVMGAGEASDYWRENSEKFDMVLIDNEGKIYVSEGIKNDFSSDYKYEIISK